MAETLAWEEDTSAENTVLTRLMMNKFFLTFRNLILKTNYNKITLKFQTKFLSSLCVLTSQELYPIIFYSNDIIILCLLHFPITSPSILANTWTQIIDDFRRLQRE